MNKVMQSRIVNAEKLAARGNGDYDKAYSLIRRIARYAIADARQWERSNTAELYNERQSVKEERRLNAWRARLDKELSEGYGLRMVNYGLYPTIVECGNENAGEVICIAYY